MLLSKKIRLDFTNKEITTIGLNRYDKDSREYIITFTDGQSDIVLDNAVNSCYIMMRKPDKTNILLTGTINNDGTVTVLFDEQMTAVEGIGYLQLKILNNDTNEAINTVLLKVVIGNSAYDESEVMSSDEFTALTDFLDAGEDLIDEMEEQVAQARAAATLSESWAVGGTDTRDGEDTNNSKYYSEQSSDFADNSEASAVRSQSWAVGGTNTRTGEDTNNSQYWSEESNDYATNSQSWAVGGTDTRDGEDTNNSQYYSGVSSDYATNSQSWAIGGTNTRTGEDTNNSQYWNTQSSANATLSESWAIGGTNTRTGEDTNNAQYYAELAINMMADEYDDTLTYIVGEYVIYNDVLYRCTTAVTTAEPFDSTKWTTDKVVNAVELLNAQAQYYATMSQTYSEMAIEMMADEYDDTATYVVGDYVIYNNQLYKCITDVTTAESFDPTKWTADKVVNAARDSAVLSQYYAGESQNYSELAINMMADEYNNTLTYAIGDYVIYNDQLYKCITAVTVAEPFDSTKWQSTILSDVAVQAKYYATMSETYAAQSLNYSQLAINMVANSYDDTATYEIGDYVIYNNQLYKCTTDVTTAESFDPTKWSAEKVVDIATGVTIDDTTTSTTSTYSSSKIEQRIATAAGATIDDSITGLTTTYSSNKIENIVADLIDDTTSDTDTTYSSDKIETLISTSVGSVIDDTTASATTTYSSTKIENVVSGLIDDTSTSLTETWSSDKLSSELGSKASIDDTSSSVSTTYSSDKIDSLVGGGGAFIDDTQTSTTTVYSSSKTETVIDTSLSDLLNLLYPVGCIVHTTAYSTSAQMVAVYGGTTWELITNRMLIGAGSTYTVGATGGSSSVTLTTSNLPSHTHSYVNTLVGSTTLTVNQIPSHTHNIWTTTGATAAIGSNYGLVANNDQASTSGATGGSGSHTHPDTTTNRTTGSTGSGNSFSVINPYKAVYIWTRTA